MFSIYCLFAHVISCVHHFILNTTGLTLIAIFFMKKFIIIALTNTKGVITANNSFSID